MPDRDDDLIAELRELDGWLAAPEPADQRVAVRERLTHRSRRPARWRAWIAAALAAVTVTVVAVEPARAAVVDAVAQVLRVAGIEVQRSERAAPPPASPSPLPSTGVVSLDVARRKAPFTVRLPAGLGEPEQVEIADPDENGVPRVVSALYRGGTVRFDQFAGSAGAFFKQAREAEWTDVGGSTAIWLSEPHTLTYVDRLGVQHTATARPATPTLIWEQGSVTYRLEGFTGLDQARAIALSLA